MTTLRQMGAKIGSRVRFIEDPEGQWRTVKTDAELDYEHLLPWVVEDNARIEELEAKLAKAVEALRGWIDFANVEGMPVLLSDLEAAELKGQSE